MTYSRAVDALPAKDDKTAYPASIIDHTLPPHVDAMIESENYASTQKNL